MKNSCRDAKQSIDQTVGAEVDDNTHKIRRKREKTIQQHHIKSQGYCRQSDKRGLHWCNNHEEMGNIIRKEQAPPTGGGPYLGGEPKQWA